MNKKILLVAINAKYIHSNLAVYNLKAASEYKENIDIAEYTINNYVDEILDDIYERKPDMLGFSCYIWNIEYVTKILTEIHKLLPQCHIWLGGPEVSYNTKYYLDSYDYISGIAVGEGEATFNEITKRFLEDESYDGIEGIVTPDNRILIPREALDLSSVPFPYEDMEDFNNKIIYYESSRGCPYSCSYCLSSIDKRLRFRNIDMVKKELSFFIAKKVPQVKFVDRTFNCDKNRSKEIWRYIIENDNLVTNFHFEIAADLIDDEQIEILNSARAGLIQLEIGVQTTNDETLKAIRRKADIEKLRKVVSALKRPRNIHLHLDLIAGLPFEDMVSFRKSFNDVYDMKPDELQLGFLKVLHGSYMYDDAIEHGVVYRDYPPYEVLYTKYISYDDILKLKKLEEVLEIYFGSGQFSKSINYMLPFFDTPFDFYMELGEYYDNLVKVGEKHSRIDRYINLLNFAKIKIDTTREKGDFDIEIFLDLLKYDVYIRENMKNRPEFFGDSTVYRDDIKELARRENLRKNIHIEPFFAKTLEYVDGKQYYNSERKENICYIAFDYDDRNPITNNAKILIF